MPTTTISTEEKEANFSLTSELPSGPLAHVFSFFPPENLALAQAVVSKKFLTRANEAEDAKKTEEDEMELGFMPGRNQKLDALFSHFFEPLSDTKTDEEEKDQPNAQDNQQANITSVQHAWLQTGHQGNSSLARKLFLNTRGEILAGRLSVKKAIEETALLASMDSNAFLKSDLQLANIGRAYLQQWQIEALTHGFTLSDLFSDWISPVHVSTLIQAIANETVDERISVESLRGLPAYKAKGLQIGFILDQVRSPQFGPVHVELAGAPYSVPVVSPLFNLSEQEALSIVLRMGEAEDHDAPSPEEWWRWRIDTPYPPAAGAFSWRTPLYIATANSSVAILAAMRDACRFTPEELPKAWRIAISTPMPSGPDEGFTPLYIALEKGYVAVLEDMRRAGQYTLEEWRIAINTPLKSGDFKGFTPLYDAASNGNVAALAAIQNAGQYTLEEWRIAINTSLELGGFKGFTPLYAAASKGNVAALAAIQNAGQYTPAEWRIQINALLISGEEEGYTPFCIAFGRGQVAALVAMGNACGFTEKEWQIAINTPLPSGPHMGLTPLYIAVVNGAPGVLATIRDTCRFTGEELQIEINKPMAFGPAAGYTALYAVTVVAHAAALLNAIQGVYQFTPAEWQILIREPLKFGLDAGFTPLYAAIVENKVDALVTLRDLCQLTEEAWQVFMNEHKVFARKHVAAVKSVQDEKKSLDQSTAPTVFFANPQAASDSAAAVSADGLHGRI